MRALLNDVCREAHFIQIMRAQKIIRNIFKYYALVLFEHVKWPVYAKYFKIHRDVRQEFRLPLPPARPAVHRGVGLGPRRGLLPHTARR